jgi:hypothetical protein
MAKGSFFGVARAGSLLLSFARDSSTRSVPIVRRLTPWYLALALMALVFVTAYVRAEDAVYLWDYRGYWSQYDEIGADIRNLQFGTVLDLTFRAILRSDYNPTPILLLEPFHLLFANDRIGYISGIALLYLIPVAFLGAHLSADTIPFGLSPGAKKETTVLLLLPVAALFPPFWTPSLRGYPDIVGLLPLGLASVLALRSELSASVWLRRSAQLGALLWGAFLLRRWYAYADLALLASSFLVETARLRMLNQLSAQRTAILAANHGIAGGTIVALAALFQPILLLRILRTDYADAYAAFQVSNYQHLANLYAYFGPVYLALSAVGAAVTVGLFLTGDDRGRAGTFFALNAVLLYLVFTRTQDFDLHHYLPLSLWLLVLAASGLSVLISYFRLSTLKALIAIYVVAGLTFASVFGALPSVIDARLAWVLPQTKIPPLKFPDRNAYNVMLDKLNAAMRPGDSFAVLGHYDQLSSELVRVLDPPLANRMVDSTIFDARDGFEIEPFQARFILVSDPPDLAGFPANQMRVITFPSERILHGKGIGAAYRRLGDGFQLRPNVTGYIFERTRPFTRDEVDELFEAFFAVYPKWRSSYRLLRLALLGDVKVHVRGEQVPLQIGNWFELPPGVAEPARVDIGATGGSDRIVGIAFSLPTRKWLRASLAHPRCLFETGENFTVSQGDRVLWSGPPPRGRATVLPVTGGEPVSIAAKALTPVDCGSVQVQVDFADALR